VGAVGAAAAWLGFCGGRQTLLARHRHLPSAWDDLLLLLLLYLQGPFWALQLGHQAVVGEHVGEGAAVQNRTAAAAAEV
jgi:hypothetical protein